MIRILALLAAMAAPAAALPSGFSKAVTQHFGVWSVHMTVVDYDLKTGDFSTPNHVTLTRTGAQVNADRARGNLKRKMAVLTGHVTMADQTGVKGPSSMSADAVQIEGGGTLYVATGDVRYEQGATIASSDRGTLDQIAHVMTLDGNVHIVNGARTLDAQHATYNTITGQGQALHGTFQVPGADLKHP